LKPLSATLRDNYRYIAFRLSYEDPATNNDVESAIVKAAKSLFGDVGVSKLSLRLVIFDGTKGLVRCDYRYIPEGLAILASIGKIRNNRVSVTTVGTSGTIRTAIEKYLQTEEKIRRIISSYVTVPISGKAVRIFGKEIDIDPEDRKTVDRAGVQFIGITIDDNERLV
jgi:ribonuclease P/MRP protein subunit POP5